MKMYENNWHDYLVKFSKLYPIRLARTQSMVAGQLWKFAFDMKRDDWVISPCSSKGVILVGEISGEYKTNFGNELGLPFNRRCDYVNTREVVWKFVIRKTDSCYQQLSGRGKQTVSQPNLTFQQLQEILGTL
jgi:predicted Mrr-cat superfamily restriction endonuclease